MALQDVISAALERIEHIAKTETVFGEPMTVGGVTLIPVSRVSVGFAAGGAGKEDKSGGSGAGTGGGVNVTPVALITIAGNDVRVHSLGDGDLDIEKLLQLAPNAVKKVAAMFKKKDKDAGKNKDNSESADSTGGNPPSAFSSDNPGSPDSAGGNPPPAFNAGSAEATPE